MKKELLTEVVDYELTQEEIDLQTKETQRMANQRELQELKSWFDNYYKVHYEKYTRLIALGKLDDNGENPQNELLELYQLAEENRLKIQEIEKE